MSDDNGLSLDFDPVAAGENIANETFVLELHIHEPGFSKKLKADSFVNNGNGNAPVEDTSDKPDADPNMLHISQDLINKKALGAIHKHKNRFIGWLKSKTVPCPMLASGLYLLPLNISEDILNASEKFVSERRDYVSALGEKYSELIENARPSRGDFFHHDDYLPWSVVGPKFDCEYRPLTFNVPAALERINSELYQREQEKLRCFFQDSAEEMRDAARLAAQEYLAHISDQLGNDESGKPRRLHESSIKKFSDFVQTFLSGGDLTNDHELKTILAQAKEILSGTDAKSIRKNEGLRTSFQTAVNQLSEQASQLVTVQRRKFNFQSEDSIEIVATSELVQNTSNGLELD